MMQSKIPAFDSTLHNTNLWLNDIMDRLGWTDPQLAYHALRQVLHTLRDRLSVDQAVALGAQLPMLIRGFYYDGWHPVGKPVKARHKDEFLAHVADGFRDDVDTDVEEVTRAILQVLARHVSPGEVKHLKLTLPHEIRELWAEESRSLWF